MDRFLQEYEQYTWRTWEYSGSKGIVSLKKLIDDAIPNQHGVYLIRAPIKLNRVNGSSDVVYIGQSGERKGKQGIQKRLFNTGGVERLIRKKIESLYPDQPFKLECTFISADSKSPGTIEEALLKAYLMKHFELPPANNQIIKGFSFEE